MKKNIVIAMYDNHDDVVKTVKKLIAGGIKKTHISVLGKGVYGETDEFELEKENENILVWGQQGAFWGSLWGLLAGGLYAWVPGFGPILATGHVVAALAGLVGGAATLGGLSAFAAMLVDLGLEKAKAVEYEKYLKEDRLLVLVHGEKEEVETAKEILRKSGGEIR